MMNPFSIIFLIIGIAIVVHNLKKPFKFQWNIAKGYWKVISETKQWQKTKGCFK